MSNPLKTISSKSIVAVIAGYLFYVFYVYFFNANVIPHSDFISPTLNISSGDLFKLFFFAILSSMIIEYVANKFGWNSIIRVLSHSLVGLLYAFFYYHWMGIENELVTFFAPPYYIHMTTLISFTLFGLLDEAARKIEFPEGIFSRKLLAVLVSVSGYILVVVITSLLTFFNLAEDAQRIFYEDAQRIFYVVVLMALPSITYVMLILLFSLFFENVANHKQWGSKTRILTHFLFGVTISLLWSNILKVIAISLLFGLADEYLRRRKGKVDNVT